MVLLIGTLFSVETNSIIVAFYRVLDPQIVPQIKYQMYFGFCGGPHIVFSRLSKTRGEAALGSRPLAWTRVGVRLRVSVRVGLG